MQRTSRIFLWAILVLLGGRLGFRGYEVGSFAQAATLGEEGSSGEEANAGETADFAGAFAYRLAGRAVLPANTFRKGPSCGRKISSQKGVVVPISDKQPIQGFSDLAIHPQGGLWALSDNGFGSRENSPDYVLVLYHLRPDFENGIITVQDLVELSDPRHLAGFALVADHSFYPGTDDSVDARIKTRRLLTGADFDPEGLVARPDGSFWLGDEFGPFLLHVNTRGELLSAPVPTPGVEAPENPFLNGRIANHPSSGGFEGLCASVDGKLLYGLLEKTAAGDPARTLRLYRFDPIQEKFVGKPPFLLYPLHGSSDRYIGAVEALDSTTVAVLERDNEEGSAARFKRIYLAHLDQREGGILHTNELADLLRIPDPVGMAAKVEGARAPATLAMPFITLEGLAKIDDHTLAVCNDNNFPFSVGRHEREGRPDDNEIILLHFEHTLGSHR